MKFAKYLAAIGAFTFVSAASADVVIDYTDDAGGVNPDGVGGLSARATFAIDGTDLTILLENTSISAPGSAGAADSLLVSIAFNLGDGLSIVSGDSSVIGAGSFGLGAWGTLEAGDSVAEQWAWTNNAGGDILDAFDQIISTSSGFGSGDYFGFDGSTNPSIGGPFGGIAADPPTVGLPGSQPAVSDSIMFSLTLSDTLTEGELAAIAGSGMVEFGSNFQYLQVPAPGALALFGILGLGSRRRR